MNGPQIFVVADGDALGIQVRNALLPAHEDLYDRLLTPGEQG